MAVTETEWGEWTEDLTDGMVTQWHDCRVAYRWEFSTWKSTGRVWVRVFLPNGKRDGWGIGLWDSECPGQRALAHYRMEVQASVERWWAQRVAKRLGVAS